MYLTKHSSMNRSKNRLYLLFGLLVMYLLLTVATVFAQDQTDTEYRPFPWDRQPQRRLDRCPTASVVRIVHLGGSDVRGCH